MSDTTPVAVGAERYINTQSELIVFCDSIADEDWITVDTEFMRERTYYPQLCLIQVGTDAQIGLIDCQQLEDLNPLWSVFNNPKILKVFHAADQDMEVLYYCSGKLPQPLFDTQLAAALLGYGDQIGYASLVGKLQNIQLSKSHSRTDWSQRPLSAKQIAYAADDVRYLTCLYPKIEAKLTHLGRRQWLEDEQSSLLNLNRYEIDPNDAWQRVKGISKLTGQRHQALQSLAAWREKVAVKSDLPRKWVLKDEVIIDLCKLMPDSLAELAQLRGINQSQIKSQGHDILAALNAKNDFNASAPESRPNRLNPKEEAMLDAILAIVKLKAEEHGLSPSMIANRKQLEQLIQGDKDVSINRGWRHQLIGQALNDFIDGKLALTSQAGGLVLKSLCV